MTTYKSKIDLWILCVLLGATLISIISIIITIVETKAVFWLLLLPIILAIAMIIDILRNTYYTINDENKKLHIRGGILISTKIDIMKITSVVASKSILSAPALSLDRLAIKQGKRTLEVISPRNKQDFITHLTTINPNIQIHL